MTGKYKPRKIDGKKYDEHRLVFEKHLGRKLKSEEVVHHIDGDKGNNLLSNLMLFPTKSAHTKFHMKNGDLKLMHGQNKKKIKNEKLQCFHCHLWKEPDKFVTRRKAHLGVLGICRECRKIERNK